MVCSVLEMLSERKSSPSLLGCRPSAWNNLGCSQYRFQLLTKSRFCLLHHDINAPFKAKSLLNLSSPRLYVGRGPYTMIFFVGILLRTVSIRLLKSLFRISVCRSLISGAAQQLQCSHPSSGSLMMLRNRWHPVFSTL